MSEFLEEVLADLSQTPKRLNSKYFYDATGDVLFQQIMSCSEYYLTRCEAEIFETHASDIAQKLKGDATEFDLIELGAGDASKTIHILRALVGSESNFTYVPIDISSSIIQLLESGLPASLPGLTVKGLNGEYLEMLRQAAASSTRKKVILFLGSNIGNMPPEIALQFCRELHSVMSEGDQILIGIDLRKHPLTVLGAYNDSAGITRAFNLNLLTRINRELGGNFDLDRFSHFPTYDPLTGACRSFLISNVRQEVRIGQHTVHFGENEPILMEISQKYSENEIERLAGSCGFTVSHRFTDSRNWFMDAIWNYRG
jgi:dimethylhistidine N-methyltransferase